VLRPWKGRRHAYDIVTLYMTLYAEGRRRLSFVCPPLNRHFSFSVGCTDKPTMSCILSCKSTEPDGCVRVSYDPARSTRIRGLLAAEPKSF